MNKPAMEVDDVVVLLLGVPSSVPRLRGCLEGITRLEKLIFLVERETGLSDYLADDADFVPYNFGPFSAKVYQEVETLVAAGMLTDSATPAGDTADAWERFTAIDTPQDLRPDDAFTVRDFALTGLGLRYYEVLANDLPTATLEELARLKDRFASLPLRQLVRYVHEKYPGYTKRSLKREDILGQPSGYDACH